MWVTSTMPGYHSDWESRMAVKRAGALLSDPKLEDEGSESTNQHEGPRKNDEPCLSLQRK